MKSTGNHSQEENTLRSFYEDHHEAYFQATAHLDPTPSLTPLVDRLKPGATILDVGCGSGRDLRWLAEHGFKPTGFELSPKLAKMAKHFSQQKVIKGDFTSFDFSKLSFDAILLVGALVHLPHTDIPAVLVHICKALGEQGLLLLSLKEGDGFSRSADGRVFTLWQPKKLDSALEESGFVILEFSRFNSTLNEDDIWLSYILRR